MGEPYYHMDHDDTDGWEEYDAKFKEHEALHHLPVASCRFCNAELEEQHDPPTDNN